MITTSTVPAAPYLKPWYRMVRDEERIVFHYADSAVILQGRAVAVLMPVLFPLLDGRHDVATIELALGERARPAVRAALEALAEKSLLVGGPPPEANLETVAFLCATGSAQFDARDDRGEDRRGYRHHRRARCGGPRDRARLRPGRRDAHGDGLRRDDRGRSRRAGRHHRRGPRAARDLRDARAQRGHAGPRPGLARDARVRRPLRTGRADVRSRRERVLRVLRDAPQGERLLRRGVRAGRARRAAGRPGAGHLDGDRRHRHARRAALDRLPRPDDSRTPCRRSRPASTPRSRCTRCCACRAARPARSSRATPRRCPGSRSRVLELQAADAAERVAAAPAQAGLALRRDRQPLLRAHGLAGRRQDLPLRIGLGRRPRRDRRRRQPVQRRNRLRPRPRVRGGARRGRRTLCGGVRRSGPRAAGARGRARPAARRSRRGRSLRRAAVRARPPLRSLHPRDAGALGARQPPARRRADPRAGRARVPQRYARARRSADRVRDQQRPGLRSDV